MKARKLSAILLAGALMATPVVSYFPAVSAQSVEDSSADGKTYSDDIFKYELLDDGTYQITKVIGTFETTDYYEMVIPSEANGKKVTSIMSDAFMGQDRIISVTIPESITDIKLGGLRFGGIENIYVSEDNKNYSSVDGVLFNKDKTELVQYPISRKDGEYTVPAGVKKIGDSAFMFCGDNISNIILPDGLVEIGKEAFETCNLTSIVIPEGVQKIGGSAFSLCSNLADITIPKSVAEIGSGAFSNTPWLDNKRTENPLVIINDILYSAQAYTEETVVIPDNVTKISDAAFSGCDKLKSVTIPDIVTSIGESAFINCSGLTSIEIPKSVTALKIRTFWGCENLTEVKLPDTLTEIPESTFYKCSNLEEITIPESVTKIGPFAFQGTNFKTLHIPKNVTLIGQNICKDAKSLTDVYFENTKEQWDKITVVDRKGAELNLIPSTQFSNATIHFKSDDTENKPTVDYSAADVDIGITASTEEGVIEEGAVLTVVTKEAEENDKSVSFDISFKKGEEEVQPKNNGKVTITIPVPPTLKNENVVDIFVYHFLDGKYYDMKAYIDDNGNIVFETDHFSEYVVTSKKIPDAIEDDSTDSDTSSNSDSNTSSDDSDSETSSDSETTSSDSNTSDSGSNKEDNADTGFGGIAMTIGIVALAGAAVVAARKRK